MVRAASKTLAKTPVDGLGRIKAAAAARMADVPPEVDLPPVAPARPEILVDRQRAARIGRLRTADDDGTRLRRADIFDALESAARRAKVDFFLTPGQVLAGRSWQALCERYYAGLGPRSALASMLPQGGGGNGALSALDCHMITARRYDRGAIAIGAGAALAVRRVRPSVRGGADRVTITDRAIVDGVALHGKTVEAVLRGHGWACNADTRRAVQRALAAALERLRDVL